MPPVTLVDAIAANDPLAVATALEDPNAPVSDDALLALVRLAWKTRNDDSDPEKILAAERARQVYDLMVCHGVDLKTATPRGTVFERIAKAQPEWPLPADRPPEANRRELQVGLTQDQRDDESVATAHQARGAMHRHRPG